MLSSVLLSFLIFHIQLLSDEREKFSLLYSLWLSIEKRGFNEMGERNKSLTHISCFFHLFIQLVDK